MNPFSCLLIINELKKPKKEIFNEFHGLNMIHFDLVCQMRQTGRNQWFKSFNEGLNFVLLL